MLYAKLIKGWVYLSHKTDSSPGSHDAKNYANLRQARVQMSLFNLKKLPFVVDTEDSLWNRCLPGSPFLQFRGGDLSDSFQDAGRKKGEWGVITVT